MSGISTRALLGAASVFVLSFTGAAQAQAPAAGSDDGLERVVVTAQKRSERNLDVPINITTYSGRFLEEQGISDFEALSAFTPGLIVQEQSPNNPGFVIRGLTSDSGEANIEPRVSIYQDGVSISRSRGSVVELFDMERIEVLKGPQSTLFGRSALIGAINLVQNKAKNDTFGSLILSAGDHGQRRVTAVANAVLATDELYGRLALTTRTHDGIVDNVLPGSATGPSELSNTDLVAGRASFRHETSVSTFDLILNFQRDTPSGTSFKSGVIPAFGGTANPFTFASLNTFGNFENGANLGLERDVYGATLLGTINIAPQWTLSSVTAARKFTSLEVFDADGSAFDLLVAAEEAEGEEFSQELRVNYDGEGIKAFVGVNVAQDEGTQRAPLGTNERQFAAWGNGAGPVAAAFLSGNPAAVAPFLGGFPFKTFHVEEFVNGGETTAVDVFADVSVNVTDEFTLTAGLRYSLEDKTTTYRGRPVNGPSTLALFLSGGLAQTLAVANTGGALQSASDTFDGVTWRLIAEYQPDQNTNFYASYARGRRPDVIDVADVNSVGTFGGFAILPEETVDSFEVGAKTLLAGGRLNLEGSLYYYGYDNFQATVNDPITLFPVFVNAGQATSYGAELQFRAKITDWLSGFGTYAWNRGRFDSDSVFANNQFRLSPDHAASLGLNAVVPVGAGIELFFRPSWTWKSEVFFEEDNDPRFVQDAFSLVNLRLGAEFDGGRFAAALYGTNLLDEEYLIDAGNTGAGIGSPTFIRGNPRFVGVEVTGKF
jgi:outer membrane receptor protein involved in Fe transport